MTRESALYNFFSSFGINAYLSTNVPHETEFPWLTYEGTSGNWGEEPVSITVQLWYHTDSEVEPNRMVRRISEAIGMGGKIINYDDGKMWIRRSNPWCINIADEADKSTRCKQLNLTIEDWRK